MIERIFYSSCYYHNQIGSFHLSHCYDIFPWLCAWDVCYIIFCHLLHIRSGKTGNLFSLLLCNLWWVQIFGYALACRSYSFVCTVHHLIIIIVQINLKALNLWNACQIYFVECVSKIKYVLSVIHYTICGAVCFQFTHFSCDDWENICTLSYYHHQIGSMNYYPFFRVRSWNNGVRCMSFYILTASTPTPKPNQSFAHPSIQTHTIYTYSTENFLHPRGGFERPQNAPGSSLCSICFQRVGVVQKRSCST